MYIHCSVGDGALHLPRFTLTPHLVTLLPLGHGLAVGGLAGAIKLEAVSYNSKTGKLEIHGGTMEISHSSAGISGGAHGFMSLGLSGWREGIKLDRSVVDVF